MSRPNISFIYVNFRSADHLKRSLESLSGVTEGIETEVIIVNNDLGEQEMIERLEKPSNIRVINLEANFGFGAANNIGAKAAQGEILFFLNPDTRYQRGSFQGLLSIFDTTPRAIVGAKLVDQSGNNERWSFGKSPTIERLFFEKFVSHHNIDDRITQTDWVSGGAFAIAKETFDDLGGFDERFFLYYEDVDLCLRAQARAYPTYHTPFLVFIHEKGKSHTSFSAMKEQYFASQRIYFQKHRGNIEYFLLCLLQPLYRRFFS